MRYRLRTLLIVLALGPPLIWWLGPKVRDAVLEGWWIMTRPDIETVVTDAAGRITANGKYYGRANPGDRVSLKSRGRVYVNGKLREPMEPWLPR